MLEYGQIRSERCPSWLKEHDWKSCKSLKRLRGFESPSLRHIDKLFRICYYNIAMRPCWNRQTGMFEGHVSRDVWVQVPLAAPSSKLAGYYVIGFFVCLIKTDKILYAIKSCYPLKSKGKVLNYKG